MNMNTDLPLKYSQPPYILIGLDLKNELLNPENFLVLQAIFFNIDDCQDFIVKQTTNDQIIVISSGQLTSDELNQLKNYSKIDGIYLFSESSNFEEQFQCIYTKAIDRNYCKIVVQLIRKNLYISGLVVDVILATLFPHLGASGGPLYAEYTLKWGCVMVVFFLGGLSLPTKTLTQELFHIRLHIFVQVFSFIIVSLIVYGICLLLAQLSFNKILIGGMIAMGCTSTGISSSVVLTRNAGGNESAALLNSILGNTLGIFISPALFWLFMLNDDVNGLHQQYSIHDYLQALFNLSITILLPLIVGQIIHFRWTETMMAAKTQFYFSELSSIMLLIAVWSIFCDLVQSGSLKTTSTLDLIVLVVLNTFLYITFSLLAMFFARLPNIFICGKPTINGDQQPLLSDAPQKPKTLIERWRFSREDTIAIMFCGATKAVVKGVTLISAVNSANNLGLIALSSLPLILYNAEQMILGAIEVILLQHWLKSKTVTNHLELLEK